MSPSISDIVVPEYEKIDSDAEFLPHEVEEILGISKSTLYNNHTTSWEAQMKKIPTLKGRLPVRKIQRGSQSRIYSVDNIYALLEFSSFYGSNRRDFMTFEQNLERHEIRMGEKALVIAEQSSDRVFEMTDLAVKVFHKYQDSGYSSHLDRAMTKASHHNVKTILDWLSYKS
ncbi:hypothetical protein HOC50_00890 [archaeon]|nr:hypothetical protein [archaeon]MBT3720750.1 hypothetical protein [archaeon]MBT4022495.1 hypothetical protein [archaeon]MBT4272334.1 hypothetical protein [archaeon]MBT4460443.1 hypothetical protein [archaeon]